MSPPKSQAIGVESQNVVGQVGCTGLSRQNVLAGCGRPSHAVVRCRSVGGVERTAERVKERWWVA